MLSHPHMLSHLHSYPHLFPTFFSYYSFIMDEAKPSIFAEIVTELFKLIKEMLDAFFEVLPTVISFIFWALSAIIILPCVFVAGTIYPQWVKWGEDF